MLSVSAAYAMRKGVEKRIGRPSDRQDETNPEQSAVVTAIK